MRGEPLGPRSQPDWLLRSPAAGARVRATTRTGTGTVKSFRGDPSFTVIGVERNGNTVALVADQRLALRLVESFGVREREDWTSMDGLIGTRCRWTENRVGVLVDLVPLLA